MFTCETPSCLTVVVTGIDGSGKSTTVEKVVNNIGGELRIIKPGPSRPVYSVVDGKKQYHYRELIRMVDALHGFADRLGNSNCVCAVNAFHVLVQSRIVEPRLTETIKPELVIGARDSLIDPAVYAIFYSPKLASLDIPSRISFLERLTGASFREIIFFLTINGQEAVNRIDNRMRVEQKDTSQVERAKWRHMHETMSNLDRLNQEYCQVIKEVQRRSRAKVFEINTGLLPQDEVAALITFNIRAKIAQKRFQISPKTSLVKV